MALEEAACRSEPVLHLTEAARHALALSFENFAALRRRGDPVYGLTTGFGPLVAYPSAGGGGTAHGMALIAHLAAGCGPLAPAPVVRATMIARANVLIQGSSGIAPDVLESYLDLLRRGVVPAVPEIGSVGASGDLIPLAHIARVLAGQGEALTLEALSQKALTQGGRPVPAADALREAGLQAVSLEGRDALGLVNGTSFMTAFAALAVARTERLLVRAEGLTGWAYRLLRCRRQALDPRLHRARGYAGQCQSAEAIGAAIEDTQAEDEARPLQEVYSLRCAPQILGACRDQVAYARRQIETELNGVNDNPVIVGSPENDDLAALHGGNFQGQQIAFAADALSAALTQAANLAERQLDVLLNPRWNGGASPLLAWEPGATSGLAGAQITATALVAEMRLHTQAHAVSSLPTNGGNQDIVSMGTAAARTAYYQAERLASILAILSMALAQLNFLRQQGRAPGAPSFLPPWMPDFAPLTDDRALRHDIDRIAAAWLQPPAEETNVAGEMGTDSSL